MEIQDFFDNLNVFFEKDDDMYVDIDASLYKNEDGTVEEIRLFNTEYDEFIVIDRHGEITCINVPDEEIIRAKEKQQTKSRRRK